MSKPGAATTKYGERYRKQNAAGKQGPIDIIRPIYGRIMAIRENSQGAYYYEVKVLADGDEHANELIGLPNTWLPLGYPASEIALSFGDKDLIVGRRVRVDFTSFNTRSGIVYFTHQQDIIHPANDANILETEAFLYAPAGKK